MRLVLLAGLALLLAQPASAEVLFRVDGVEGSMEEEPHAGWLPALDYTEYTRVHPRDPKQSSWGLGVERRLDASSPALAGLAGTGEVVPRIVLAVREDYGEAGRLEVARYELTGARIKDRSVRSSGSRGRTEKLTLTAQAVRMIYIERDDAGKETLRTQSRWAVKTTVETPAAEQAGADAVRAPRTAETRAKRR